MLQTIQRILHIIRITNMLLLILVICSCEGNNFSYDEFNSAYEDEYVSSSDIPQYTENVYDVDKHEETLPIFKEVFSSEIIPKDIQSKMWNVTISERSYLTFDDLSYLTLTYMGYDDCPHIGHLVVDKDLSNEIICIFRELYKIKFPIEKMNLPCEYGGVDELSMEDNNTSAFNDRPIEGSGGLSYHQLGRAIDVNPLVNPYIKFSTNAILPATGEIYLDRTLDEKGMITEESECVKIFKKYGWSWGGDWHSLKDYQHFEKE